MRILKIFILIFLSIFISVTVTNSREISGNKTNNNNKSTVCDKSVCAVIHNIGNMELVVHENGLFGYGSYFLFRGSPIADCLTGEHISESMEFPKGSGLETLRGASIWLGGVMDFDTLVSASYDPERYYSNNESELANDPSINGFIYRSTIDKDDIYRSGAISEQDFITVYTDTSHVYAYDYIRKNHHIPLNLKVIQKSYAWSYPYSKDFVIFSLNIQNIGTKAIRNFYMGIYFNPNLILYIKGGGYDEQFGFLRDFPAITGCGYRDTVNIAWAADNEGDVYEGEFLDEVIWVCDGFDGSPNPAPVCIPYKSNRNIMGISFLDIKDKIELQSYNWWAYGWYGDRIYFEPRLKKNYTSNPNLRYPYPLGDLNKYRMMSNGEIDYPLAMLHDITSNNLDWETPPYPAEEALAKGSRAENLLSRGPYNMAPGASIDIVFAIAGGENFHNLTNNIYNLPLHPYKYFENVDFSDLVKNMVWASKIYDNPGVDTDGDGFFGKYRICNFDSVLTDTGWAISKADTTYYEGDGVPDWRAAGPPPAPVIWAEPILNGIKIRFNGHNSETEKDFMTGKIDFEGYNIWIGRDDRESSLSLVASYDIENYDKFVWDADLQPLPNYVLIDEPFTMTELRCLYGNSCNDSLFNLFYYSKVNPYIHPYYPDSVFYFAPHHQNANLHNGHNSIRKVYPDASQPPSNIHPDSLSEEWYTPEGYLKYYEYEYIIQNLLSTVPYWVNVTCFDQGSPATDLLPLETSKSVNLIEIYPYLNSEQINQSELKVYVFPNPYLYNGEYRKSGFEGRNEDFLPDDKVRAIHFANLPHKCAIRIFTLDGDLVREFWHDFDEDDPNRFFDEWNLVNKNRQLVVSGLYYWTVEDESGRVQMGKIAIIM